MVSPPQLIRSVLQMSVLLLLSRLLGAGMTKSVAAAPRILSVPYSDFLRCVQADRVATVQVDAVNLLFTLQCAIGCYGSAGSTLLRRAILFLVSIISCFKY